jgi:hypothetical protein
MKAWNSGWITQDLKALAQHPNTSYVSTLKRNILYIPESSRRLFFAGNAVSFQQPSQALRE